MIQKREFGSMDDLLHFIAEESPEQFAVVRSDESVWELAFFVPVPAEPTAV